MYPANDFTYGGTSLLRTLWGQPFCPLFEVLSFSQRLKGPRGVSFAVKLSLFQSVLDQRFHCNTLDFKLTAVKIIGKFVSCAFLLVEVVAFLLVEVVIATS